MSEQPFHLSEEQRMHLLARYRDKQVESLVYGTAADFCDSNDHIPLLSKIQGDLKDLQRPAALKTILSLYPPGASLLEVGAGEPYVAQMLADIGYNMTVVDPYDGSGRGPTEFDYYREKYPKVLLLKNVFSAALPLEAESFDCIYSISVLEHVHQPSLGSLFDGISLFLKRGGHSFHIIDHVLEGEGYEFHLLQLAEILFLQDRLATQNTPRLLTSFHDLLSRAARETETFFLSPQSHNLWRGQTTYEQFPFRKVISIHSCERRSPKVEAALIED